MEPAKTLPDARVDATWIVSHIDDPSVRFVEIDVSAAAYNAGHIPGAVLCNAYTDLRHSDYRPVSAAELQDLLRKSGVTPDRNRPLIASFLQHAKEGAHRARKTGNPGN
jgi:3-mercaptopyruvate sulfurtransferase SseA